MSTDSTDVLDFAEDGRSGLPGSINVLTILTFIGSGFGLLISFAYPWFMNFSKRMMEQAAASGKEFTAKQLADMEKGKAAIAIAQANIVPLITTWIIASVLCIVGALLMRKLRKDGFWVYLGGELLPLVGSFILLGTSQFNGVFSMVIACGIPLLFIILYANQRKYLVK